MNNSLNKPQTKNYYDDHGREWAEAHNTERFWDKFFDNFYELVPSGALLEIGFGGLRDGKELINHGYTYTGIDSSSTMVEIAHETDLKGTFLEMNAQDLNFEGKFECFWASASLLHVPKSQIDLVLQNISKALKPNGVGFISVKKHVDDKPDERMETDEWGERFFAVWSFEDFKAVLERNGFKIEFFEEEKSSPRTTWLKFIVRKASES